MHSDEKPYICDICGKAFKKIDYLKGHRKIHDPTIRIQCQFCGKTFNKSGNLKAHELTHSTDKPHKCHLCTKGFIQYRYLKAHLKSCTTRHNRKGGGGSANATNHKTSEMLNSKEEIHFKESSNSSEI